MGPTRLAILLLSLGFVAACGSVDNGTAGGGGAGTGGGTGTVNNPPAGVVNDSAGFYVDYVKSANYTYVNHAGNATFSSPCVIQSGTGSAQSLVDCFVEAQELDLYFNGISLQYNVPSTMCNYFEVNPYYYYKWHTGDGPTFVQVDTDASGNTGIDPGNTGTITGPSQTCAYDYTAIKGPNCCTGTYTKVTRSWNSTSSPPGYTVTGNTDNVPWGGDPSQCISGPAVDSQPKNAANFPVPVIYYVQGTGINGIYTVKPPISTMRGSDISVANYYSGAESGAAPPAPLIIPAYDFLCFDRSQEVIAEIRTYVRRWNTASDFAAMASNPAGYQNTGMEPSPWGALPNDDYWSWLDFASGSNPSNPYPQFGE